MSKPKPVSIGESPEVEIYAMHPNGQGLAKIDDFVIFVNGAQKGEKCKARINDVKNTYATADKV